jgi:hypothetical protein
MSLNNYNMLCDDFYVDMYVNTELDLPNSKDTILSFFERVRKQFPSMGCFYRSANNEYSLEEDSSRGQYRWISLQTDRIGSGVVNPSSFETAYCQDRLVLELIPYMLSVVPLDISSLDLTLAMDFDYAGSHDEVIAEALLGQSAFSCLMDLPGARPVGCSPSVVISLSNDDRTQCRISIESKTNVCSTKKKEQVIDEAISLSFTIRQYPAPEEIFDSLKSFEHQCKLAEEIMAEKIVPNFVMPLTETIEQKRLI